MRLGSDGHRPPVLYSDNKTGFKCVEIAVRGTGRLRPPLACIFFMGSYMKPVDILWCQWLRLFRGNVKTLIHIRTRKNRLKLERHGKGKAAKRPSNLPILASLYIRSHFTAVPTRYSKCVSLTTPRS